jgi:hypothetical protein
MERDLLRQELQAELVAMMSGFKERTVGYVGLAGIYASFLLVALYGRAVPMADDAAIGFRYVEQILAGHGVVYNEAGPHVYGASALPYVFVLAGIRMLGVPMDVAALIVNCVSLAAVVVLLYGLLRSSFDISGVIPSWALALVPCVVALTQGEVLIWVTQGLESGFHLLLCVAAIWAYDRRREELCAGFLALALMDKLDALSLWGAIGLVHVARERRFPLRLFTMAVIAYLPWLVGTTLYFGSPVPMSMQAKLLQEFSAAGHQFVGHYRDLWEIVAVALAAPLVLRRPFVLIMAGWFVLYVLMYDGIAREGAAPWYFFPSDFTIFALCGMTFAGLLQASIGKMSRWRSTGMPRLWSARLLAAVGTCALLVGCVFSDLRTARSALGAMRQYANHVEQDRVDIGMFIREQADPAETVFSGHGWIQYLSRLRVYDASGLNDPEVVERRRALMRSVHHSSLDDLTDAERTMVRHEESAYLTLHVPTYLVGHAYVPPDDIVNDYVLVASFTRTNLVTDWPNWNLWARRDSAAVRRLEHRNLPLIFPEQP